MQHSMLSSDPRFSNLAETSTHPHIVVVNRTFRNSRQGASWQRAAAAIAAALALTMTVVLLSQSDVTKEGTSSLTLSSLDEAASDDYFLVPSGTFAEVRAKCLEGGGDLASIDNQDDIQKAKNLCGGRRCYIGLTRDGPSAPFFWLDGSPLAFTAWERGQPQRSETVVVTGVNGDNWHDWGVGLNRFEGLCERLDRAISKPCYQITDCKECLQAKDPRAEWASACVPIKPEINGNVCEPKRYIEKVKDTMQLQEDTECGIVSEDEPDVARQYYSGSVPIMSWRGGKTCVDAEFPSAFSVQDASVHVQITAEHSKLSTYRSHGPTTIWVEGVTAKGFRLCVQETTSQGLADRANNHVDMSVNYLAYSQAPFSGSRIGDVKVQLGEGGVACAPLHFAPAFSDHTSKPLVLATITHHDAQGQHPVESVWLEDISWSGAKACLSYPASGDHDSSFHISYLALSTNPEEEDSGEVTVPAWTWRNEQQSKQCVKVKFDKFWVIPPQVQATVNHRGTEHENDDKPHDVMTVWVEDVTQEEAEICVMQFPLPDLPKEHPALSVSWLATGPSACPFGEALSTGTLASFYYFDRPITAMPSTSGLIPNDHVVMSDIDLKTPMDFSKAVSDFPATNVAEVWSGVLYIKLGGYYNFNIVSNSKTHIFVDGVLVVDGQGAGRSYLGRVHLAPGAHKFWADWFESSGGNERMTVSYSGPDTGYRYMVVNGAHCSPPQELESIVLLRPGFKADFYYIGEDLSVVPSFTDREPDSHDVVDTINYRNGNDFKARIADFPVSKVAAVWSGVIFIENPGEYTFSTESDDGSHLWIDGVQVVDNDGLHAPRTVSGKRNLEGGYHVCKADFFEMQGGEKMVVTYKGPDTHDNTILLPGFHLASVHAGAQVSVYPLGGDVTTFPPDIKSGEAEPQSTGTSNTIEFMKNSDFSAVVPDFPANHVAVVWKGFFEIVRDGEYQFSLGSNDGSRLVVDSSAVVDDGGDHGYRTMREKMHLSPGIHEAVVEWFDNDKSERIQVQYSGPDTDRRWEHLEFVSTSDDDLTENGMANGFKSYLFYNLAWEGGQPPNLEVLSPVHERVSYKLNYRNPLDWKVLASDWPTGPVGVIWNGMFVIRQSGLYTFNVTSSNSSLLRVDANQVVDDTQMHSLRSKTGQIQLEEGYHYIDVVLFSVGQGTTMLLSFAGPDTNEESIYLEGLHFNPPPPPLPPPPLQDGHGFCTSWFYSPYGNNAITKVPYNTVIDPQKMTVQQYMQLSGLADLESVVGEGRAGRLWLRFNGRLKIEEGGFYNFCLQAKDYAQLSVRGGQILRSDTNKDEKLCKKKYMYAGDHRIVLDFFENGDSPSLDVTYSGADTEDEEKPLPSVGYDEATCEVEKKTCPCGAGWCSRWYFNPTGANSEGTEYPDLSGINPQSVRRLPDVSLRSASDFRRFTGGFSPSQIAISFDGIIYVKQPGDYEFCLESDDGSKFSLDGEQVVEKALDHESGSACQTKTLANGQHPATLEYFNDGDEANLRLTWKGPDTRDQVVSLQSRWHSASTCGVDPNAARYLALPPSPPPPASTSSSSTSNSAERYWPSDGLLLNYYCRKYYTAPSRKDHYMEKCAAQDCQQADESTCKWVNEDGLCFIEPGGQGFCDANPSDARCFTAPPNPLHPPCASAAPKAVVSPPAPAPVVGEGGFQLVFRQTMPYLFKELAIFLSMNAGDPDSDNYSIMGQLESFRGGDGKLHLKLYYPEGGVYQEWKQTTNPVTAENGGVEGFESIHSASHGEYWGGLEHNGVQAWLDGSVNHQNWWYAVGSREVYQGGIPGISTVNNVVQKVELYAWVEVGVAPDEEHPEAKEYSCEELHG
eukprot:CAMPEP_0181327790 /NCGR_PEP_ID=MMETSP1101-20121128/22308_1 /TAXON_ID=46948 /ORGANISM="Rhodomonas abbreviata, Strain Caron Lab Isolate" /LENGTH=1838 /DNA_ID=CAMNT_0023436511 /DNA_START=117 /DNA_END=5629 /DNA_ORIENTATION=-